jgi:hypothetical protein
VCAYSESRCHGCEGTSMRYMSVDSSARHGRRPAEFRIATSDVAGCFRTPHARGVWKVSREGGFRRSQERQNSLQASIQTSIEGCTASMAFFFTPMFFILMHLLSEQYHQWMLLRARAIFLGPEPLCYGKSPDHWRRETRMRFKRSMDRMAV